MVIDHLLYQGNLISYSTGGGKVMPRMVMTGYNIFMHTLQSIVFCKHF